MAQIIVNVPEPSPDDLPWPLIWSHWFLVEARKAGIPVIGIKVEKDSALIVPEKKLEI